MSRASTRRQHKQFCDTEGWGELRNARGGRVQHHITYELGLGDGRVLRTRVSRPANNETYGPNLWSAILRDQLDVTEADFWRCVEDGAPPPRPLPPQPWSAAALPASLVYQLLHTLGLDERTVAGLTRNDAVRLMTEHWSRPSQ